MPQVPQVPHLPHEMSAGLTSRPEDVSRPAGQQNTAMTDGRSGQVETPRGRIGENVLHFTLSYAAIPLPAPSGAHPSRRQTAALASLGRRTQLWLRAGQRHPTSQTRDESEASAAHVLLYEVPLHPHLASFGYRRTKRCSGRVASFSLFGAPPSPATGEVTSKTGFSNSEASTWRLSTCDEGNEGMRGRKETCTPAQTRFLGLLLHCRDLLVTALLHISRMHLQNRCSATRRTDAVSGRLLWRWSSPVAASAHPPRSGPVDVPRAACALNWRHVERRLLSWQRLSSSPNCARNCTSHSPTTTTLGSDVLVVSCSESPSPRARDLRNVIIRWSSTLCGLSSVEDRTIPPAAANITCSISDGLILGAR